jgi:hypothetical protein
MRHGFLCRLGRDLMPLLLIVVAAGCGQSDFGNVRQPTFPVQGKVTLDGKPLPGATIVFKPLDPARFKWRETPQAKTDQDGQFTVFTYASDDGAPAGEYRVGIAVLGGGDDEGGDQVRRDASAAKLPASYADAATSGLTTNVEAKPNTLPTFELTGR